MLHSNAEFSSLLAVVSGLGTSTKAGLCNFWLNGGFNQEPCPPGNFTAWLQASADLVQGNLNAGIKAGTDVVACSHVRSGEVYANNLLKSCAAGFSGIPCPSCGTFVEGALPQVPASTDTVPLMADYDCTAAQDFYVQSSKVSPYCD